MYSFLVRKIRPPLSDIYFLGFWEIPIACLEQEFKFESMVPFLKLVVDKIGSQVERALLIADRISQLTWRGDFLESGLGTWWWVCPWSDFSDLRGPCPQVRQSMYPSGKLILDTRENYPYGPAQASWCKSASREFVFFPLGLVEGWSLQPQMGILECLRVPSAPVLRPWVTDHLGESHGYICP